MKIGIGFFGIPRNSDRTFESIQHNIIVPAARVGTVLPRYHFYQQSHVVNQRSKEDGVLAPHQYQPFMAFQGELESPDGVIERYEFAEVGARGDAWGDGKQSLRNLLLQLHSLHCVTRQIELLSPDIVLFARPDLLYHNSFEPALQAMLTSRSERTVRLPFWQWAGGYNDRFALCGREAFAVYGKRIEQITAYLTAYPSKPLHAERLLRFTLDKELVSVRRLDVQATRIRVNGDEAKECFAGVQANRLIRWALREGKKSALRVLKGDSR